MGSDDLIKVVAFGDSITEGTYGGATETRVWTSILQRKFQESNFHIEIINAGIPGETAPQGYRRFLYHVLAKNPDIVLMMYGANDSYDPFGTGNPAVSVPRFTDALEAMISGATEKHITPVLMTTTPLFLLDELSSNQNALLDSYMGKVRDLAEKHRLPLIDHFLVWMEKERIGENMVQYLPDGVHPNAEGNRIIAETILQPLTGIVQEVINT